MSARYFVPSSPTYQAAGCVRYWSWTKRRGLWCYLRDGSNWKSEWRTLPAFLRAVREGRETPVQERPTAP